MFTVKVHAIEQSEQTIDAMLRNVVKLSSSEEIQEEDGSNGDAHVADEEAEEDKEATAVGISGTAVETGDAAAAAAADGGCDGTRIIKFSSGNPRVEATRGVMHLFRDTSVDPGSLEHLPVRILKTALHCTALYRFLFSLMATILGFVLVLGHLAECLKSSHESNLESVENMGTQ
jgi:hypothetical protein